MKNWIFVNLDSAKFPIILLPLIFREFDCEWWRLISHLFWQANFSQYLLRKKYSNNADILPPNTNKRQLDSKRYLSGIWFCSGQSLCKYYLFFTATVIRLLYISQSSSSATSRALNNIRAQRYHFEGSTYITFLKSIKISTKKNQMKQIHHIIFILLLRDYFFHPFIYIQNPYEGPERNINIIRVIILVERERETRMSTKNKIFLGLWSWPTTRRPSLGEQKCYKLSIKNIH